MSVEIPKVLIERLRGLGPHFVKVAKKGKEPFERGWQKPENLLLADNPRLQAWLKKGGNYGVVGGYGLAIVDVDHAELKKIAEEKLPRSFKVLTPGHKGWHLYFLCSLERPIRLRDKNGGNMGDIQSTGKMVVGPNCVHPNGGTYRVIDDCGFAQITREQLIGAFGECVVPDREVERIETMARMEKSKAKINLGILQAVPLIGLKKRGGEYFGVHPVHGSETGQNFWVNPSKNCWHCFRHGTGGGPLLWLAVEEGLISCEEASSGALRGPIFKQVLAKAVERGLIKEASKTEKQVLSRGDYFDGSGKFIPKLLADEIMVYETFITLMDSKETYVWREGYYQPLGAIVIEQHCKDLLQEDFRKNRFSEALEYIKVSTFTKALEPPRSLINLENGVLNIKTNELEPHGHNHYFFNKLNIEYDPKREAPLTWKFFRDITGSEEDAHFLEEIVGYCLLRDYPYAKALALVGEGANGKSTFLALVKEFLGHRNVSGKGLNDLEFNRFAKASLFGKLANIYADLSDDTLKKTGIFKMLTGGDVIEAEKKFRDSFTFVNYAKLLFSCNKLPEVYDNTDAFFRRWLIVTFPNVFKGENCDPYILEKLTVSHELSGLLNMALKGLARVLGNKGFSYSKSTEEVREDYIRKSDPLAAFILDCIEENHDSTLLKQRLYSLFAFYCRQANLPAVNKDTFFKNISKHVSITQVRLNRKDIPGRPYGYKGITLTEKGKKLWSDQSNQSPLFPILIKETAENSEREQIKHKIGQTLDSSDCLDQLSFGEKLKQLREWISQNKDIDGLVDALQLSEKCNNLEIEPQDAVKALKEDKILFNIPNVHKFGVVA